MILVSPKVSFSYNIRSTLHPRTYFKRWRRGEVSSAGWISSARPPKKKKKEKELWATSGADEDTAPVIGRGVLTRGGGRAARVASCPHEEEHSGSQSQRETRASKPSTPKNSSLSLGRPRKTFLPPSPPLFCSTKWRLRVAIERRSDVSASDFTISDAWLVSSLSSSLWYACKSSPRLCVIEWK